MNILQAIDDPRVFGTAFKNKDSWNAWRAFLAALFGLGMDREREAIYRACTGRQSLPERPFTEAWAICGRRGGKSFVMALVAVYLACFRSYAEHLNVGERATVFVIAADRRQARTVMRYIGGLLAIPVLAKLVERESAESFDLSGRVTIEVAACSFRSVRGYTLVAAICDEIAFWRSEESANPDTEILAALRPALATIPGSMLLCASSPYSRRGALWEAFRRYHGKDDVPVLVWKAPTQTMNPGIPKRLIDDEYERDPARAAAEYGAEFRTDVETFVAREAVEACVAPGVFERPRAAGVRYCAFVDPSGGSADDMTMAVAHREGQAIVLDCVRAVKPPFSPDAVAAEFAAVLRGYGLTRVVGDRYGGEWPRERLAAYGVRYDLSTRSKSDLYREALPLFNAGRVDLLDHQKLVLQLCALERRTARGGRDSIDHPPGAHDDIANAVAGAVVLAATKRRGIKISDEALRLASQPPDWFLGRVN